MNIYIIEEINGTNEEIISVENDYFYTEKSAIDFLIKKYKEFPLEYFEDKLFFKDGRSIYKTFIILKLKNNSRAQSNRLSLTEMEIFENMLAVKKIKEQYE